MSSTKTIYTVEYSYYENYKIYVYESEKEARESFEQEVFGESGQGYSDISLIYWEVPEGVEYTTDSRRVNTFKKKNSFQDYYADVDTLTFYRTEKSVDEDGDEVEEDVIIELEPTLVYSSPIEELTIQRRPETRPEGLTDEEWADEWEFTTDDYDKGYEYRYVIGEGGEWADSVEQARDDMRSVLYL
jgi:hypothetical protein